MKILLIGEVCQDVFQYGTADRVCSEAPCLVFNPTHKTENEGMAGNVLANIKSIDSTVEVDCLFNKSRPYKIRYVESKSNQMIMRQDINDHIGESVNLNGVDFGSYDAIVVSDYNKGFISKEDIQYISESHSITFLDTKKKLGGWSEKISFIKINSTEYENTKDTCIEENLIVTLGSNGAMYKNEIFPAEKVASLMDVSGAGDTFLAALVCEYLKSKDIRQSIVFANKMAGIVVGKKGVCTP